ncbi:hypothetical protein SAMN05428988_3236 [Chitinophaga sp. YR573]|uniref:hypothetical protein n=1 Tax=Chitinophaga sp. YR573 TaxID=1881040 RepID=UPI0008C0D6A1|nr:hypothetical protein [Chitinophaga sp. YR573]SEW21675.1 hypothetical protein SAMN05428988_3236 [Chitinophaga sp. YR573]
MIQYILRWIQSNGNKVKYLLVLIVILILCHFTCRKLIGVLSPSDTATSTLEPVRNITDNNGKILAVIRSQELKLLENKLLIDSLAGALRIKPTAVKSIERYVVRTDTVIRTDVKYVRTADSVILSKDDSYLHLLAVGKDSGISYFRLKHTDTICRVEVIKAPLLRRAYTDIYLRSASPYNTIVSGNSIRVISPQPFLTIGPYIGYDPFVNKMSFGLSVQYPVIKIYKK